MVKGGCRRPVHASSRLILLVVAFYVRILLPTWDCSLASIQTSFKGSRDPEMSLGGSRDSTTFKRLHQVRNPDPSPPGTYYSELRPLNGP